MLPINIIDYFGSKEEKKNKKNEMNEISIIMEKKWNDHINKELIDIIRLLNLEKDFKYSKESINFLVVWGRNYLTTYGLIGNLDKNDVDNNTIIENTIRLQLNEFISRQNEFKTINRDHENLRNTYEKQNKKYNIKMLWTLYIPTHYEISTIAIAILSICPSEASVERSFSIQSDIHTIERNRLSEELIDAEMNIKVNIKE